MADHAEQVTQEGNFLGNPGRLQRIILWFQERQSEERHQDHQRGQQKGSHELEKPHPWKLHDEHNIGQARRVWGHTRRNTMNS